MLAYKFAEAIDILTNESRHHEVEGENLPLLSGNALKVCVCEEEESVLIELDNKSLPLRDV